MGHLDTTADHRAGIGFIRNAMSTPILTREHEHALAVRWRESGDRAALHCLIRAYARLVAGIASRYRHYGLPMADLLQEGHIGLMLAAARFEPERGVRFSTYAAWWVRSQMQDYVLRNWSIVRTGTTSVQKRLFFNLRRLRARIESTSGRPLDEAGCRRIADSLGVSVEDVAIMDLRLTAGDRSLNASLREDGDDAAQDFLCDERPTPEEAAIASHDRKVRDRCIAEALAELPLRERRIVTERLLRDDAVTLETLGQSLGISKERVRQLELRALGRLRIAICRRIPETSDLFVEA